MIASAVAANVVAPRTTQQFGPGDPVTQTDLAGALSRAGLIKVPATSSPQAQLQALYNSVLQGVTKVTGTILPQLTGSLTRAEAAEIIFMALRTR